MKTFCISDTHGAYDELMALYKQLPINPKKDRMVFLGDYIDRGPKSKQVIQQLINWQKKYPHWVFLLGNHEDLMLDSLLHGGKEYHSFDLWYQQGGKQTHHSYLPKNLSLYKKAISQVEDFISDQHLCWLDSLPRYFEDEHYIYVHAGLKPGKTVAETDPYDLIWIRDEFIDSDYNWGKKIIFGHTANKQNGKFEPIIMDNKIGIDTAVCPPSRYGLTAVELPTEKFYFQKALENHS